MARSPLTRPARRLLRAVGAAVGASILSALGRTVRLRVEGEDGVRDVIEGAGGCVFAFWHGRFWLPASRMRRYRSGVLVSLSEDGEVIARAARRLGFHPVRGSSSRGGREGLAALEAGLTGGGTVAMTPDGPRGPGRVAQIGAVVLAARSGKPLVPVGASAAPAWTLGSWDRFQIPRPFARGCIVFGVPIAVPPDADLEPWRRLLEERLGEAERRADAAVAR